MFFISVLLSAFGLSFGTYVVIQALTGNPQDGWSSLMAVVVFFFSLNAVFTGLIGLYVKKVLEEVKTDPARSSRKCMAKYKQRRISLESDHYGGRQRLAFIPFIEGF